MKNSRIYHTTRLTPVTFSPLRRNILKTSKLTIFFIILSLGMFTSRSVLAVDYTFTSIDFPGGIPSELFLHDINDTGQIVGTTYDDTGSVSFLREPNGTFVDITESNWVASSANGINNSGQIVGHLNFGFGDVHGFLRETDGTIIQIDVPGTSTENARGINDSGQIVGTAGGNWFGFLRDIDGTYTEFNLFPDPAEPYAINNSGQVVGQSSTGPYSHGFLRETDGTMIIIDVPGASYTFIRGINDAGQMVGLYIDGSGTHAFLRDTDGTITHIVFPGSPYTVVEGMNNLGQLVGYYYEPGFEVKHGFLATPIKLAVEIDIKPGSFPNSINLCSHGAVPIAILGSDAFDVNDIHKETLRFAEAAVKVVGKKDPHTLCSIEDANGDFINDLICQFVTTDIAAVDGESTSVTLNGELLNGTPIEGTDSVNIVKDTCN